MSQSSASPDTTTTDDSPIVTATISSDTVTQTETTITRTTVVQTTVTETVVVSAPAAPVQRQKVAILGGGVGALTTAFELTNQPGWQERYDITVYQVGWRLGGKGASGRGPNGRIEEHGLHIWLGFYDNAFRVIQQAYAELNRPAGTPLATWDAAFKAHNYIGVAEKVGGEWRNWMLNFPTNDRVPGDAGELPTLWEYLTMTLQLLHEHFMEVAGRNPTLQEECCDRPTWFGNLIGHALMDIENVLETGCLCVGEMCLRTARHLAEALPADPDQHSAADHHLLARLLGEVVGWMRGKVDQQLDSDDELRHLWLFTDLAAAMIQGVLMDGVLYHEEGLDILDGLDFRAWLQKHGASEMSFNSGLVQGLYDLVFAYHNGEVERPSFAAGAALRSLLRIDFTYKGSVFWKMQASMGDTIFTPLYEVLSRRGVKFEFFHRVRNLALSADKSQVAAIQVGRQVTLKQGDSTQYDPFITVKDLKCWPSQANFDQIVEGEALQNGIVNGQKVQDGPINLESFWTPWPDVETKTLKLGEDFDLVVLGISIGSFPYLCPELIAANPQFSDMVNQVETVRTMAMQLWLKPDLAGLGWELPSPVIDGYAEPQNTWADMSYLLDRESWPAGVQPQNIAYYCGPMVGGVPASDDMTFPQTASDQVKAANIAWLNQNSGYLWPKAAPADNPNGLDWNLLADTTNGEGVARFDSQFWRANIDPSERYVLSVAGSTQFRLRADESGFTNLFLTGDWIQNEFNMGCVEATVMSGMQCSHAISGYPALEDIVGQFHP